MQSQIFNINWERFDYRDLEQRRQLIGALQVYCALPHKFVPDRFAKVEEFIKAHAEKQRQLQMFTLASDFPQTPSQLIGTLQTALDYDNAYEQIYDVRNYAGTKGSGFDIASIASGLTFNQVLPGEKLKVYQMSGGLAHCYFSYYGGALGWHRQLFEDGNYWQAEQNAVEFRNKAYSTRATVFYNLLEAAADAKGCCAVVPADCSDCAADARSIAASINYAAQTILTACKDKGYGLNPQTTQFIVLTPIGMRGRVRQALGVQGQSFVGGEKIVDYNFIQMTSLMLTNPTRVMVILPKRGFVAGYKMDLTLFEDFDMLSYTDTVAGWMRYGGCVADLDQIECINFTAVSGSCPPSPSGFYRTSPIPEDLEESGR